jgi:hypothetical protein
MSEPVVVRLRKPITFGNRTVEQLNIRPPKAKDMRRMRESDGRMATALKMASLLTGEIDEVIDELEGLDLGEVIGVVNDFFLAIHGTSET